MISAVEEQLDWLGIANIVETRIKATEWSRRESITPR
jgi:hypothetical protein